MNVYNPTGKLKNQSAFTLLEMTIALGIFVILITSTLGIYSYSIKAEQRTIQISKLQKEAQLIMEIIAKKIRSNRVDYTYYGGSVDGAGGETVLALLDKSNQQTVFRLHNNSIEVCIEDCGLEENFNALPASDVIVDDLKFFISPARNPFSLDAPPVEFPKVTAVITLKNTRAGVTRNLFVQQTLPQRLPGI